MTDEMAYTDRDDGLHAYDSPVYYERWYFDAQFNNGYMCATALFWRRHSGSNQPSVVIDIYGPDGRKIHADEAFDTDAGRASWDKCDVSLGPSYVRQEGPDLYHAVIRSDRVGVDLIFRRRVPGWKVSPGGLLIDGATGKHGWINAVPRADVEGKLFFEGNSLPVRGLGYHDHNWGNVEMGESFRGWVWGRVFDLKYTLVYGWLLPLSAGAPVKPFLYTAMGNQPIFASAEMELNITSEATHQSSGNVIPTDIELRGRAPWGVEVNFRMVMVKLLDWEKVGHSNGSLANCYRRLSKCVAEVSIGAMNEHAAGDALDEYVLLK